MSVITASFARVEGALTLVIDATPLHDYLDLVGVPYDGGRYADAPGERRSLDTYTHTVQPFALLARGVQRIGLSAYYTSPIPKTTLEALARSIEPAAIRIIDHYRPVTLRVEIALKVPAPAPAGGAP
jgi:hypothetical protein